MVLLATKDTQMHGNLGAVREVEHWGKLSREEVLTSLLLFQMGRLLPSLFVEHAVFEVGPRVVHSTIFLPVLVELIVI